MIPKIAASKVDFMRQEGCSVWILPQLVAPKTDLNQARVVGETVTQTEQNRECSVLH
jgi:hypothetical protein